VWDPHVRGTGCPGAVLVWLWLSFDDGRKEKKDSEGTFSEYSDPPFDRLIKIPNMANQKRKADESISNDTKQSTTGVDDAKKPKIEENIKIVLHPLPPTPTGEWANQGWKIDEILEDPQEIASYKQANNIDASLQIDMIIPGSYVRYGDPIGGDSGVDVTNGPVRCYPCRCSTQSFTNQHGTSSIRKEAWIDKAMNLVVEQKERADDEPDEVVRRSNESDEESEEEYDDEFHRPSTSFYNAVKDMTRSDFEDEYDANFANIPSYCWSNGIWYKDEIIVDCGAIIPCKHCGRQVLALGLKEHELCSRHKEEIVVVPFRDYVVAMFEHRTDWIAEGCDGPFNYYCWANRIGSEGFDGSTDFLKNAIANDSFKNIDEMIKKNKEKRRIQNEKYQRARKERERAR